MGQLIDLTGKKIDRLTVIKNIGFKYYKDRRLQNYLCLCDCGNYCERTIANLNVKNRFHSCGCYKLEQVIEIGHQPTNALKKHGKSDERIYDTYHSMKRRCYKDTDKYYDNYGGRGIKVCEEWLGNNGFNNFYNWAINNGYQDNLTIDRIDVNGDYSPQNCRWSTRQEQMENTRRTRKFTINGETHSLTWWANKYNIPRSTVYYRLERGLNIEEALQIS